MTDKVGTSKTRCKVCFSPLRDKIEAYARQGYSANWIAVNYCKSAGLDIDYKTLRRHFQNHTDIAITTEQVIEKRKVTPRNDVDLSPELASLEEINAVFDELGLPHDLNGISLDMLIEACQRITARLYLRQCAIVDVLQRKYADGGQSHHPTDQIKGMKALQECMQTSWAYGTAVSIPQAIRVLEAEGYRIENPAYLLQDAETIDVKGF